MKRILCLLTDGFEEIEALAPVDLLKRAGAEVTLASLTKSLAVKGRSGITVQADLLLDEADRSDFDLLLIPGGPGVKAMREDGRSAKLAKAQIENGRPVAAICAAPLILEDAGLLCRARFTAHFSTKEELPGALVEERVVEDGLLITSRGAGTALDFGLVLVRRLYSQAKSDEIAQAIML